MSTTTKQTAWEIQRTVVYAIFVRELNSRFARFKLGYLWALLEPISVIVILSLIRGRFTAGYVAGINPVLFFASGIIAYLLFRNIATSSLLSIEANRGLFNYQRVKPADILVARGILDLLVALGTSCFIFPGMYLSGFKFTWNNSLEVMAALVCLLMLAGGLGCVCSVLGPLWPEARKVVPMFIRPLFYASGIFYPANSIPPGLKKYALMNPLLHAIEILRGAMFAGYTSHEGNWMFLFCCSISCFFIGLAIHRVFQKTVVTSGNIR